MVCVVIGAIFAGGTGSRMNGAGTPKQYLLLGTKPIIVHTTEKFLSNPRFEKTIVLCPEQWVDSTREMMEKHFGKTARIEVIEGGITRNDTLSCALGYIEEHFGLDDETVIVTHDAVRPFITQKIINENIESAIKFGACGTYIPACDTIAESGDGETVVFIPERRRMFQTQTPQSFKAKKLKTAFEALTADEKAKLTDAAMVFTIKGEPVQMVAGEVYNIKITYPYDLIVAKAVLESGIFN